MKILSIDGGGVFGAIPAYLLRNIDITQFDAYAGTSIGSVLALSYALGNDPVELYNKFMKQISSVFSDTNYFFMARPKYKDKNLNSILQDFLIGKISDLKKIVVVPTFDFINNCPIIINNKDCGDLNLWECVRMSSAAPSYFKPWKGCLDGGIIANNPTMVAITYLCDAYNLEHEDLEIMSIGTGHLTRVKYTQDQIESMYRWSWISPMVDMLTGGNEAITALQVSKFPLKKYMRFNDIQLGNGWDFTDASKLNDCVELAKGVESNFIKQSSEFFENDKRLGNIYFS